MDKRQFDLMMKELKTIRRLLQRAVGEVGELQEAAEADETAELDPLKNVPGLTAEDRQRVAEAAAQNAPERRLLGPPRAGHGGGPSSARARGQPP